MKHPRSTLATHFAAALLLALVSSPAQAQASAQASPVSEQLVVTQYSALVYANYQDALASAQTMQATIQAFIAAPFADSLANARKAWLAAREIYSQTEAFRFYAGPIDDDKNVEGRINAWPIDESYIDYVKDKPNAGLINNKKIAITKKNLIANNERGSEENISTGWHAIEFLLWGQDFNEQGPGNRSFEDYIDDKARNADRRRRYLNVVTEILIDDLRYLNKAWAPNTKNNYRARFDKGNRESLRKIFIGLGSLSRGELAGERLEVALASQDQEDEHSCFSDNTQRDAVNNARGIQNIWSGRYKKADGTVLEGSSLQALIAIKDAALAERMTKQIALSVANTEAIHAPFDQEILGAKDSPGRLRVQKAIDSLTQQSKDLVEAANAIGISRLTLVTP